MFVTVIDTKNCSLSIALTVTNKNRKSLNKWYYPPSHRLNVNVMLSNITLLMIFAVFDLSTHYTMSYPQNGDRMVTTDSVTSLQPMYTHTVCYTVKISPEAAGLTYSQQMWESCRCRRPKSGADVRRSIHTTWHLLHRSSMPDPSPASHPNRNWHSTPQS